MLFPEVPGIACLAVDIMDTMFFNKDCSMTYIYTDPRRGLTRVKARNYTELFLKRKAEMDSSQPRGARRDESFELSTEVLRCLEYVALVRYKDGSFIRLKEQEFRSIFVRPVQAYQKYKMSNNTQYIQMLPQLVNFDEATLHTIEFELDKHRHTQYFQKVTEGHLQ
jgi:hypothetical protein